jgi:hypothetical protein
MVVVVSQCVGKVAWWSGLSQDSFDGRLKEIWAHPHQHVLASPPLFTPLDDSHGEQAEIWEATERWQGSPGEGGEQWHCR